MSWTNRNAVFRMLKLAFSRIRSKSPDVAGPDGLTARGIQAWHRYLAQIRDGLISGQFRFGELRQSTIRKGNGKTRTIWIENLTDRIVGRAIAYCLSEELDKSFFDGSYAYRPGRSRKQAIQKAVRLAVKAPVVVKLDIADCFSSIPKQSLIDLIAELGICSRTKLLLSEYILRMPGKGLLQGTVLSPFLSNLYLDKFDSVIADAGYAHIRYADDIAIFCRDEIEAKEAEELAKQSLRNLGLRLSVEKTKIIDCRVKALRFVGYELRNGKLYIPQTALKRIRDRIGKPGWQSKAKGWLNAYPNLQKLVPQLAELSK